MRGLYNTTRDIYCYQCHISSYCWSCRKCYLLICVCHMQASKQCFWKQILPVRKYSMRKGCLHTRSTWLNLQLVFAENIFKYYDAIKLCFVSTLIVYCKSISAQRRICCNYQIDGMTIRWIALYNMPISEEK